MPRVLKVCRDKDISMLRLGFKQQLDGVINGRCITRLLAEYCSLCSKRAPLDYRLHPTALAGFMKFALLLAHHPAVYQRTLLTGSKNTVKPAAVMQPDRSGPSDMKRKAEDMEVRISKDMSRILRHAPPPGAMDSEGWIALPVLLKHLKHRPTEETVKTIVAGNDKKRFVLDDTTNPPRIRAAQGHSVQLESPVLEEVTDAAQVPVAVHVTSKEGWVAIRDSGELRRMSRTHVHFATQPHHARSNSWATVLLRLNLQAAIEANLKFFLSANQVLLCEGPVPVQFVTEITMADLPEEWHTAKVAQNQGNPSHPRHAQHHSRQPQAAPKVSAAANPSEAPTVTGATAAAATATAVPGATATALPAAATAISDCTAASPTSSVAAVEPRATAPTSVKHQFTGPGAHPSTKQQPILYQPPATVTGNSRNKGASGFGLVQQQARKKAEAPKFTDADFPALGS